MNTLLTPANERKWHVFVNGLFMSGHYSEGGARREAKRFKTGHVEIRKAL